MKRVTFERSIERDSTFVTQQFFARNLTVDLAEQYGIDSPYRPVVAHYANPENIQLFENKEALHWIQDRLLEKNLTSESFMRTILDHHREFLPRIEEMWGKKTLSGKEFEAYKKLARELTLNITIYYYAAVDERTPKAIQDAVVEIRKTDEFGARNDQFVRDVVVARGLDPELARGLQLSELLTPDARTLGRRRQGSWLIDGELVEMTFEEFRAAHTEYVFEGIEHVGQVFTLHGQIAQKGTARGKVKIVKNRAQAAEVEQDDILVSPMTQPDFIQAMQRAAAFVTDEGGVVCHAAVIAREMKKPCIVGTKIATQVFKDGDMVEVDADNGIVRKL
jgi:phosphoenolpyruvate synthase/pyruvate phosphate dikinase